MPVRQRARAVRRIRDDLVEHADDLAATISRENGKTRLDALVTEIFAAAMAVTYYARHAKGFLRGPRCARRVCSWPTSGAASGVSRGA